MQHTPLVPAIEEIEKWANYSVCYKRKGQPLDTHVYKGVQAIDWLKDPNCRVLMCRLLPAIEKAKRYDVVVDWLTVPFRLAIKEQFFGHPIPVRVYHSCSDCMGTFFPLGGGWMCRAWFEAPQARHCVLCTMGEPELRVVAEPTGLEELKRSIRE